MEKKALVLLLLLLLIPISNAQSILKGIHPCFNTETTELGNLAFGKYFEATDGNLATNIPFDEPITIDLGKRYAITSHTIRSDTTESYFCIQQIRVSGSDDGISYQTLYNTDEFSKYRQLDEIRNNTPHTYRFWKFEPVYSCPNTKLYEIQLNATPQVCYPAFFQLVNYTNKTSWMGVYAEYSFNDTDNNHNRIILEENNTNANITEIEDKFKDYDLQYPLVAAYNQTTNEVYSVGKTNEADNLCKRVNIRKITLNTHDASKSLAWEDSGWYDANHWIVGGFGNNNLILGLWQSQDLSCIGSADKTWRILKVDLKTGDKLRWSNDTAPSFDSHNYFVGDDGRLLFPIMENGAIYSKEYVWSVNSSGFALVFNSSGDESQPHFVGSGSALVFSSDKDGNRELYLVPAGCNNECQASRLTFTAFNESILSVVDEPEKNAFAVAFRFEQEPFVVRAAEFRLSPYSQGTVANQTIAGRRAQFSANWTDAFGLAGFIFSTNNSGEWKNYSAAGLTGIENESSFDLELNGTAGIAVGWRFYAFDGQGSTGVIAGAIELVDGDAPRYGEVWHNSSRAGETSGFWAQWSDNFNLSSFVFSFDNGSGSLRNDSQNAFSGNNSLSRTVKQLSELAGVIARWLFYAWDEYGNFNATQVQSFTIVESTPPSVSCYNTPATRGPTVNFSFTAFDASGFSHATLYTNFSGVWGANSTNATTIGNGTQTMITVDGITEGGYSWNILVCDSFGNCAFASANSSIRVDRTPPSVTTPSTLAPNATTIVILWESGENSTGAVEFWDGSGNTRNESNGSYSNNLSVELDGLSQGGQYWYKTWTCDEAGNCVSSDSHEFTTPSNSNPLSVPSGGSYSALPAAATTSNNQTPNPGEPALGTGSGNSIENTPKNNTKNNLPSTGGAVKREPETNVTAAAGGNQSERQESDAVLNRQGEQKPDFLTGLVLGSERSLQRSALLSITVLLLIAGAYGVWRRFGGRGKDFSGEQSKEAGEDSWQGFS